MKKSKKRASGPVYLDLNQEYEALNPLLRHLAWSLVTGNDVAAGGSLNGKDLTLEEFYQFLAFLNSDKNFDPIFLSWREFVEFRQRKRDGEESAIADADKTLCRYCSAFNPAGVYVQMPNHMTQYPQGISFYPSERTEPRKNIVFYEEVDPVLREMAEDARRRKVKTHEEVTGAIEHFHDMLVKLRKGKGTMTPLEVVELHDGYNVPIGVLVEYCNGGVCRHKAPLLAYLLVQAAVPETGASVSVVQGNVRKPTTTRDGAHVWADISMGDETLSSDPAYVLDRPYMKRGSRQWRMTYHDKSEALPVYVPATMLGEVEHALR